MKRFPLEIFAVALFAVFLHLDHSTPPTAKMPRPPKEVIHSQYRVVIQHLRAFALDPGMIVRALGYEPAGTAIGVSKRQLICCAHELDKVNDNIFLDIFDDDGVFDRRLPLSIVKSSTNDDLCLLSTDQDLPYFVDIYKNKKFEVGDWVYAIGSRMGCTPYAISFGSCSTKNFEESPGKLGCSLEVFGGNSGGGLYEADGNTLIGVVEGGYASDRKGLSGCAFTFSIPIRAVREWISREGLEISH
jgi:hypothetical protein